MDAFEERTAALRSGLRVPYAAAGHAGESVPLVLVHAYVESWRYFEPVIRALPRTIRAFAPTQRGHRSVEGDPAGYLVSDFASDIVDFMDAVGLTQAVLVGASSGGSICRALAARHPERVAGLVLISSPVTLADKPGVSEMREEIVALSDPVDRVFVEQFVRGTSPDDMPEDLVARLVQESSAIPAEVWRESFLGLLQADLVEALEDIGVPSLLIGGGSDPFVRDDQQVLLERIPHAELLVYDGVGHSPHLTHPARVAADLTEYLRRHQPSTGRSSHPSFDVLREPVCTVLEDLRSSRGSNRGVLRATVRGTPRHRVADGARRRGCRA